jgi:hypothetical protein
MGEAMLQLDEQLRRAATECLQLAQSAANPDQRARLLMLAEKFEGLSGAGLSNHAVLTSLLEEFNDAQMLKQ